MKISYRALALVWKAFHDLPTIIETNSAKNAYQ
jgi:hypothetical protein